MRQVALNLYTLEELTEQVRNKVLCSSFNGQLLSRLRKTADETFERHGLEVREASIIPGSFNPYRFSFRTLDVERVLSRCHAHELFNRVLNSTLEYRIDVNGNPKGDDWCYDVHVFFPKTSGDPRQSDPALKTESEGFEEWLLETLHYTMEDLDKELEEVIRNFNGPRFRDKEFLADGSEYMHKGLENE